MLNSVHFRVSLDEHSNRLLLIGYTHDCKSFQELWFHSGHIIHNFYVLLPMHPCIILQIEPTWCTIFFLICLLLFSTCFRQLCAHHQEKLLYLCDTWYLSLYLDDCPVCRAYGNEPLGSIKCGEFLH